MRQYITSLEEYINNKKLPFGFHFYNPFLEQQIILTGSGAYFYDTEYNLLFKDLSLKATEEIHFVDEDLCLFTYTSSTKVALYSIKSRAIVERISLRLPKSFGTLVQICRAMYLKKKKAIVFIAWYNPINNVSKYGKRHIFLYEMTTQKYSLLYAEEYSECFGYADKIIFANIYSENKNSFLVIDDELTCTKIEIDKHLQEKCNGLWRGFDPANGLIVYYDRNDTFDGYNYYGKGKNGLCIKLDGCIDIWHPKRRFVKENEKNEFVKACNNYTDGITQELLDELNDEELINWGYSWVANNLYEKAQKTNKSVVELILSGQVPCEENILYSIGWFVAELEEGGLVQYFNNGNEQEFQCLLQVLKTIGAISTMKIIEEGIKLNSKGVSAEECDKLEEKLDEDYIGLAIKYIKKEKGLN